MIDIVYEEIRERRRSARVFHFRLTQSVPNAAANLPEFLKRTQKVLLIVNLGVAKGVAAIL